MIDCGYQGGGGLLLLLNSEILLVLALGVQAIHQIFI